jgi:hypothetical protein
LPEVQDGHLYRRIKTMKKLTSAFSGVTAEYLTAAELSKQGYMESAGVTPFAHFANKFGGSLVFGH